MNSLKAYEKWYGERFTGIWYNPVTKKYHTPTDLISNPVWVNWKVKDNVLWPHDGKTPLEYDEEA